MSFDRRLFADKLSRCCAQFGMDATSLAKASGGETVRCLDLLSGAVEPTGDEILILADVFKIDFKFFVSGDAKTPFDQLEILYRRYGDKIDAADRRSIAELLYLCDTEAYLQAEMGAERQSTFAFTKTGTFFKGHGEQAAVALRAHLNLSPTTLIGDVFALARGLGVHVFRRRLADTNISGITIRHPGAGACILVNFEEDPYRQRFTLAHELGHVFLDAENDVVVSFTKWEAKDLVEIRANTFASHLLVPRAALHALRGAPADDAAFISLATRLEVNAETLARSLEDAGIITAIDAKRFRGLRLSRSTKGDPELGQGLTKRQRDRKYEMLERGLSQSYVQLCFSAYGASRISRGRLAEALLVDQDELIEVATLYGEQLAHA